MKVVRAPRGFGAGVVRVETVERALVQHGAAAEVRPIVPEQHSCRSDDPR